MGEIIDIYDDGMNHIGTMDKDEAHRTGQWHKNAHIWIFRRMPEMQILIQKRTNHGQYPNFWDVAVGGHLTVGDTPYEGAIREWEEELGIPVPADFPATHVAINKNRIAAFDPKNPHEPFGEFQYIYLVECDLDITKLNLQEKEVAAVKWVTITELEKLFDKATSLSLIEKGSPQGAREKFVPHTKKYFDTVLKLLRET